MVNDPVGFPGMFRMILYVFTSWSMPKSKKSSCFMKNIARAPCIISPKPNPQREFSEYCKLSLGHGALFFFTEACCENPMRVFFPVFYERPIGRRDVRSRARVILNKFSIRIFNVFWPAPISKRRNFYFNAIGIFFFFFFGAPFFLFFFFFFFFFFASSPV